jgi:tetratricopeptide (TPR) repeat protein
MHACRPVLVAVLAALLLQAAPAVRADEVADLQKPEKAVEKFEKATKSAPDDADSWYNLGLAYSKLERWKDAAAALTKATTLNAANSRAWYFLGQARTKAGDGAGAVTAYEKAIELGVVEAQADIGQAYYAAGKYDEAIEAYKAALKAEGAKKGPIYNQIGVAYLKKGDTANAVKWFERNVEEAPDSATTYYNLGQMYRKAAADDPSLWKKSADMLVKAAQMDPKNATGLFLAGEALIMAGQINTDPAMQKSGVVWIDKYLAADPGGKKSGAKVYAMAQQYKREVK